MQTNQQLLDEITAAMADAWISSCNSRVIVNTLVPTKFMVIDARLGTRLFGPALADECLKFVHRAAAFDVLKMLGTERVAKASFIATADGLTATPPRI
jgi:hypothetical protein